MSNFFAFSKDKIEDLKRHKFLFEELVKRDFKKKYQGTILGMFWSILNPLLMLLVLAFFFGVFFARNTEHYIIYLFSGQIIFGYFSEATSDGMRALLSNGAIFSKIDVPKYLFLFSKNVSYFINFCLILLIYFCFVVFYQLPITWKFLCLLFPIGCLVVMNLGFGLILSAWNMFYRDTEYLYGVVTRLVMYGSAIFYPTNAFPPFMQRIFYCNPIFCCIDYFRSVVIKGVIPGFELHALLIFYALLIFGIGAYIYKKNNYKFIYYV